MRQISRERMLLEASLAVVVNTAAGVLVFFLTRSVVSALVVVVVLEATAISLLYARLRQKPGFVGVVGTAREFSKGPDPIQIGESVSSEFVFWGISAKSLLSNDEFRDIMLRKCKGRCSFRFLLLDPSSVYVALKAAEERDTPEGWKNEIEANVVRLQKLRDEHSLNIHVRLYDERPIYRIIFTNSSHMYFGWYPAGRQGIHSPLLIVENSPRSLYQPMRLAFEDLWTRARDPLAAGAGGNV